MAESSNSFRTRPLPRIVLCRPEGSRNVGSVCRAMKNMGFEELVIVPEPSVPLDPEEVRTMAVHAASLYEQARVFPSLAEALAESPLACGVTRRRGSRRKEVSLSPEELAERLASYPGQEPASLVFGNEQSGLNEEEMRLCHLAVHIPSNPECPSLNLSHAVQVITYVLSVRRLPAGPARKSVTRAEAAAAAQRFVEGLRRMDYFNASIPENRTAELAEDILCRAALSPRELRRLETLLRRAAYRGGRLNKENLDE